MAATAAPNARTAETNNPQQKGPTGPPYTAETEPLTDLLPGQQSCWISSAVEAVTKAERKTQNEEWKTRDAEWATSGHSAFFILLLGGPRSSVR
jgi:hypothetical protein